jgi:molybdate/tungstate transport system permease protein
MTAGGGPAPHRRRFGRGPPWIVLQLALSASLLLLFALPILVLFSYAGPAQIFDQFHDLATDAAIELTLLASGVAVLAAIVFAIPVGYLLARHRFRGQSVVEAAVALPVAVPHLLVGLGLFLLLLPGSILYRFTNEIGFPIYDTIWGVVLVMVFVSAPYTILASQLAFRSVDPRVLESARSLGAGPATAFLTVSFPIALRGIVAGLLLTWARAVSEIGGILIIAYTIYPAGIWEGPPTNTVSVLVYDLFGNGDLRGAAAVSCVFLLIAFAIFLVVRVGERSGWLPWWRGELGP